MNEHATAPERLPSTPWAASGDAFAQARQYLARVLPWPENPGDAYIDIVWTFVPPDGNVRTDANGKKLYPWTGVAVSSVNEAISLIARKQKQDNTRDIYACLSSQRHYEEKTSANGFKWKKAIRNQPNAFALKSLFIDLDAKGEDKNSYANITDAAAALGAFIKAIGFPNPSIIVSSGGGLHVYWVMASALTPEEWQPLAHALVNAAKQHGLKFDSACTIDSARVMRIPNTANRKFDPPQPVKIAGTPTDFDYSVERLAKPLEPYRATRTAAQPASSFLLDPSLFPPRQPINDNELGAGINISKGMAVDLDSVATECAFIRDAITTGGMNYTNPLWNLTTLIATFTEGGRADAHRMGNKHPGYTHKSTDDFFDRKEREKAEKGLGWPACETISASGCMACQTCPHFVANKSPLNFARSALPSQVTAADPEEVDYVPGSEEACGTRRRMPLKGGFYGPTEALALFNSHFFVALVNGACPIAQILDDGTITYLAPKDFNLLVQNIVLRKDDGKVVSGARFWLGHPDRHQRKIVFRPGGTIAPSEYNLWRGFAVNPVKGWAKQRRLLRHILRVVCRRDKTKFKYLIKWLAWAVQQPDQRAETVIVLQSRAQGSGKTTLSHLMRDLFGRHGRTINSKARLLNQFNADLETVCWISGEEMLWAGDKGGADALKSIITGDTITLEVKNGPRWDVENRLHLLLTTNHVHAVVAGTNERRHFVLDVSDEKVGDGTWFEHLYADLRNGGKEQFLWLLQSLRLGNWHPRQLPKTAETADQQRMSADSVVQWASACCEADAVIAAAGGRLGELGTTIETQELLSSYAGYCRQRNLTTADDRRFGKALTAMFGPQARKRMSASSTRKGRPYTYDVPDGEAWRKAIDKYLGI
jgi:hypothetical protein